MKMAGAKYVFLPQLDGFEDRTETLQYQEVGRSSVNRKVFLSAVVQIEDTTTSGIMPDAPTVQLERMETMSMVQQGALMESDKFLVMLAKDMANQLCQKVVAVLRPAKVLDVTGKQIMINRGTEAGFNQGDLLEVYTAQDIVDDDTGEKFRKEIPIGKARLVRVDSRQGFALIEGEDMGIQKGCIVRTVQPSSRTVTKAVGDLDDASKPEPANNVDSLSPGSSEKPIKF
jgi:hypothetical protein